MVRFLQEDGADVASGEPFVEVEAMKMIMPLKATESGKINHEMSPGSIIAAGDLLASLQLAVSPCSRRSDGFTISPVLFLCGPDSRVVAESFFMVLIFGVVLHVGRFTCVRPRPLLACR